MLDIQWGSPYTIKEGSVTKWRREWCIPVEMVDGFFIFWKRNRFKLLVDGFSVTKSAKTGKWFLHETKSNVKLFKSFTEEPANPEDKFVLPPYEVKNKDGLRAWQVDAVAKLVSAIKHWGAAIDGSDCGLGKTYSACAVARELDLKICVVCPKAVISSWKRVITTHFGMANKLVGIINYEKLRVGKKDSPIASFVLHRHSKRPTFEWKLPKSTLIIWDESQKLKNWKTQNAKRCVDAIKAGYPMLFCSATNATNPLEMRAVGQALKMFSGNQSYYTWAYEHGVYKGTWSLEFNNDPKVLKRIHRQLFEHRGVRLRRDDILDFPKCEIIPEMYNMDEEDVNKINEIFSEMERELKKLEKIKKSDSESELVIRLRARQSSELIKVPLFVDMIEEAKEQGFSVVVFVNFTETLNAIAARIRTSCIFDGKINEKTRNNNIDLFQSDKERVILVNIASGGAGLNLHDLHGNYPRMSIVSPNDSAVLMRQCLGRIWRDDGKTKSIQKIVFVANTVEECVCENVKMKLNNLDLLNDGDLTPGKY
jgi:superfamily II DNA or RNA helicase